ncbi:uncharacterized protein F4812DRAFT_356614 [Daldinia caldariorum]|uniref:uncharacterized protein n=1 Tax=Daldinia caldariorum TaxID=326644 RepID=UPI00200868F6|nr:uncharacterized protein F4812DRAFT_356614 [Daldinia caldariorum]KAI1469053.1 hypothetical protein F4812DRAFT_356614 [Daldinia caldariorum]
MGVATINVIASATMLKSLSDYQTETTKDAILMWVFGSVIILVLILIFNQHRAAGIEEWGPSRGLYTDSPWIEMGNRNNRNGGRPQQARYPLHPQPAITAPHQNESSVYRHSGTSVEQESGRNRFNLNARDDRFDRYAVQRLPFHQNSNSGGPSDGQHQATQPQVRDPSAASSVDSGIGIARSSSLLEEEAGKLAESAGSTGEEAVVASEELSSSPSAESSFTDADTGYLSSSESGSPPRRSGLAPRESWCLQPSFSSSNLLDVKSGTANASTFPPRSSSFTLASSQGAFASAERKYGVETNFSYPYSTTFTELSPILEHSNEDHPAPQEVA